MALKMTVEAGDGTTIEIDAKPCTFCDGRGTMRESKAYAVRSIDDGFEESEERRAIIGEQCPMCLGRGLVGCVGG